MAILIPTKNIYHLDAPFSSDNKILGVSYEPVNNIVVEQNGVLFNGTYSVTTKQDEVYGNESFRADIRTPQTLMTFALASYAAYKGHGFVQTDVVIPIFGENKAVSSVDTGTDESGNPKISVSATFSVKKGSATSKGSFSTASAVNMGEIDYSYVGRFDDVTSIPESITNEQTEGNYAATATVNLSRGIENLGAVNAVKTTRDGKDVYLIQGLTFLSRVVVVKMRYFGGNTSTYFQNVDFKGEYEKYSLISATVTVNGVSVEIQRGDTYPVYVGEQGKKSVSITTGNDFVQKGAVEAKTIASNANVLVDIPDISLAGVYYGSYSIDETGQLGSVDVYVDPADEFVRLEYKFYNYFQNAGIPKASISLGDACYVVYSDGTYAPNLGQLKYNDGDDSLFISLQSIRGDIAKFSFFGSAYILDVFSRCYADSLEKYRTGKECMELELSISDYYNEDGSLAISADGNGRMCFDIGDEVIVMAKVDGVDSPISVEGGIPNRFAVIKRKMIYDGSVLQGLSLQRI